MAIKAELFKFRLFHFSRLQFLWKHHFPCLMVTSAVSGSKISNNLILQTVPRGLLQWFFKSELEHRHITCVCCKPGTVHLEAFQSLLSPLPLLFCQHWNTEAVPVIGNVCVQLGCQQGIEVGEWLREHE